MNGLSFYFSQESWGNLSDLYTITELTNNSLSITYNRYVEELFDDTLFCGTINGTSNLVNSELPE